jgi:NTE family protein
MYQGRLQYRGRRSIAFSLLGSAFLWVSLAGCAAHYPINPGEDSVVRQSQYQVKKMEQARSDEVFMVLCFSGGGTRAASMSYGVLEALQAVNLPARQTVQAQDRSTATKTLLDEVNVIMSVSGGSFTAAYYGLHGKDIFKSFREDFLLRDVQGALFWSVMNPFNWPRLASAQFDRSDLAQEYYDEILFKGATLGDMIKKEGPLVNILATDAIEGVSFSFVPQQFNLICSDYDRFPVSRAVTASSAFPGPFSPIVLKNYAGQCGYKVPEWVMKAVENPDLSSRVYWLASSLYLYTDSKAKPHIYLIDGGVADNLGVQAVIESVAGQGGIRSALEKSGLSNIGRVAFVVVDAQTRIRRGTIFGDIPGLGFVVDSSSTIMINRNNFNTMDLLRRYVSDWNAADVAAGRKPLDVYIVHLNFDALPDVKEREYFNDIPTALSLPAEQVDKLRDVAGRLLYSNQDFRRLVTDIGGNIPVKAGQPERAAVNDNKDEKTDGR